MTPQSKHPLDALLRPRSVAVLGASAREDSMGQWSLKNLLRGGFSGAIYPVNPRYEEISGRRCYRSCGELPAVPDLVIFAVGDQRIEGALDEVIAAGVPAAVIMSTLAVDNDGTPPLRERVRTRVRDAGMLLCGANGMGFYNVRDRVWACGFDSREHPFPGNVSLISHSGSGMSGIIDCEERLRVNLAVSTGNELGVTMDQYIDFALDLPETRAIGLFVETARNPAGFRDALAKARDKGIPIVALKVGRTQEAARLTVSHSGAMAGDSATYDALFEHYGVQQVRDMDELATALILFAENYPLGPGGLVSLHDSGGERQLMIDLADDAGVPLTQLAAATVEALQEVIDPELPAVNPLDAWSRGGEPARGQMTRSLSIMLKDPGAAIGVVAHDRAPDGYVYGSYIDYMETARRESGKPVALVAARQGSGCDPRAVAATHRGMPVLDGLQGFLTGVRAMFAYRDFQAHIEPPAAAEPPREATAFWRQQLATGRTLDEHDSLQLLADFGIEANAGHIVEDEAQLAASAATIGYPLVAKTAMPGALHKTEMRGVHLGLEDGQALAAAWRDLSTRGPQRVLLAPML
ncbi:MAG TPA: CoA-binding protein, partial [Woeseiaceae bacterium]|nr:CoA-binding protein [Woeseiaceae bacterium]